MRTLRVRVSADGRVRALYNESLEAYAEKLGLKKVRASYVEPVNLLLRKAFHWLRKRFGDDGRVAAWTRTWPCRWQVDMSPIGGEIVTTDDQGESFASRRAAIDFEVGKIETLMGLGR